jgi:GxxExxY protein
MTQDGIGDIIVTSAIHLHKDLGPGLLESGYEIMLTRKLEPYGLLVRRQVPVPIEYEGQNLVSALI